MKEVTLQNDYVFNINNKIVNKIELDEVEENYIYFNIFLMIDKENYKKLYETKIRNFNDLLNFEKNQLVKFYKEKIVDNKLLKKALNNEISPIKILKFVEENNFFDVLNHCDDLSLRSEYILKLTSLQNEATNKNRSEILEYYKNYVLSE